MTKNREINTKFNTEVESETITLEALSSCVHGGKAMTKGQTITLPKSEAKELLKEHKHVYRIKMNS